MKIFSLESAKRRWKWIVVGALTLLPAAAFAAEHVGVSGCSCPICSLMH